MADMENLNLKKLKIYVGGISSQANKSRIKTYFETFGPIFKVQTFCKQPKKNSDQVPASKIKGFCIVIVRDEVTLSKILSQKEHCFEGRKIICSQFVTGSELEINNREKNQRRVILKGIPSEYPEDMLKAFLERMAGEIEVLFPFKSDKPKKVKVVEIKKLRTYSVMFSSVDSAEKLLLARDLILPSGELISANRFILKRNKALSNPSEESILLKTVQKIESTSIDNFSAPRSHKFPIGQGTSGHFQVPSNHSFESLVNESSYVYAGIRDRRTFHPGLQAHNVKPTSTSYLRHCGTREDIVREYRFNLTYRERISPSCLSLSH